MMQPSDVAVCSSCGERRIWTRYSLNPSDGTEGMNLCGPCTEGIRFGTVAVTDARLRAMAMSDVTTGGAKR